LIIYFRLFDDILDLLTTFHDLKIDYVFNVNKTNLFSNSNLNLLDFGIDYNNTNDDQRFIIYRFKRMNSLQQ